jgi:hypothetical protein
VLSIKKAQGISINTIIVAAIGLAVLVVLFAIFTGRIGIFSKGVQETDTCVQKCSSLNMDPGVHPSEGARSCFEGQYIAGSYVDGPNGCCCMAKP